MIKKLSWIVDELLGLTSFVNSKCAVDLRLRNINERELVSFLTQVSLCFLFFFFFGLSSINLSLKVCKFFFHGTYHSKRIVKWFSCNGSSRWGPQDVRFGTRKRLQIYKNKYTVKGCVKEISLATRLMLSWTSKTVIRKEYMDACVYPVFGTRKFLKRGTRKCLCSCLQNFYSRDSEVFTVREKIIQLFHVILPTVQHSISRHQFTYS